MTALTYLIQAEQNHCCYTAFCQHTKPKSQGGLGYITEIILDQDEMNNTLLEHSHTHFAKAQGSPFTVEPLMQLLQYDGLTPLGNQVLTGCADLESLSLNCPTNTLLCNMWDKMPSPTLHAHPLNYEEDLQWGIKKWKEGTTTSPLGHHLGIYRLLLCHVLNDTEQKKYQQQHPLDLIIQGQDVLHLVFDIMTLALHHTYMLEHWQTVWTMFIEKELGNPDLARLWCIMIFEADWQLLRKWHSLHSFLPKSEINHALTDAQGGGRKGCSAINQATQQVLNMEVIRLNQCLALDLFLDACPCFNLMVEVCHNMACQRHGAVEDYLRLHAQMHCLMKYYV